MIKRPYTLFVICIALSCCFSVADAQKPTVEIQAEPETPVKPTIGDTLRYRVFIRNAGDVIGFRLKFSDPADIATRFSVENWGEKQSGTLNPMEQTFESSTQLIGVSIRNIFLLEFPDVSAGTGEIRVTGTLRIHPRAAVKLGAAVNVDVSLPITVHPRLSNPVPVPLPVKPETRPDPPGIVADAQKPTVEIQAEPGTPVKPAVGDTLRYRVFIRNAGDVIGFRLTFFDPHLSTRFSVENWGEKQSGTLNPMEQTFESSTQLIGVSIRNIFLLEFPDVSAGTGEIRVTGTLRMHPRAAVNPGRTVNVDVSLPITVSAPAGVTPQPAGIVSIPDPNLAAAMRKALGLGANAPISKQAMQRLTKLEVINSEIKSGIKNLTGLEHATQLTELRLFNHQIRNISPLTGLTRLKRLMVESNQISNIIPLAGLTQLELLYLGANQINNQGVQRLSKLTQLKWLSLYGNQISNITPLASLTKLEQLHLVDNQIRDVSPLAGLKNLEVLYLQGNPIQDASPLAALTKLRHTDIDIPDPQPNSGNVPPEPAVSVPPAEPVPVKDVVSIPDRTSAVPTTGTWLFVNKPSNLTSDNFTIGPGEFAVLVHQSEQNATEKGNFKTYALYHTPEGNADLPNLAHFFQNGGRIELVSHASHNPLPRDTKEPQFGDIIISEIMWGLNRSSPAKQYIELYNASAHTYTFWHGNLSFRFSKASESPLPAGVFPLPPNPGAHTKVVDRVSNKGWKVPGKSGNIEKNEPLISMYREMKYTAGTVPDGTLARSWKASKERVNLPAPSYGTPGARHLSPRPVVLVAASQRPPMYWIDADAGTLHRLVGDEVENIVPNVQNATSLAVDMKGGKLYWTTKTNERRGKIYRVNLNGTPRIEELRDLYGVPLEIAVDPQREKLYWIDALNRIQGADLNVQNIQNILRDLNAPKHITLDVGRGKLYWTETTEELGRIRRANLDGSSVQNVATNLSEPLSLAVANDKIYWTEKTPENSGKLQRADLDGTNSEVLQTLPIAPISISIDTTRNSLYLTTLSGEIHRRDLDGSGSQPVVTGLVSPSNIVLGIRPTPPATTNTPEPSPTPVVDAAADVNQDKKVNKADLLLVVTALGEKPPANSNFDVNADGTVNIADVLLVIEALDDPVAAAAPVLGGTITALDPGQLAMQIDILRAESDGSMKYEHAIAFFQSLLASIRPSETQLLANYPNPFNPETWIPYQLAMPTEVRLRIYSVNGTLVRTLSLGHQPAGVYQSKGRAAYWDGRNALGEHVASGIYFYQLQTDEMSTLRKMVILK